MPVPYPNFASATTSIPLSQLDNNFATTITLGNVAVQLGNTVTTIGNVTLTNTTISGLSGGSANGVVYINSSNVAVASPAVLTFDGTNLGLGVTPNAGWGSNAKVVDFVGDGTVFAQTNASIISLGNNFYWNNTDFKYKTGTVGAPVFASKYTQFQGKHIWSNAPTGTAGSTITFTDAMTLDASSNLLVGQTSISAASTGFFVSPNFGGTSGNCIIYAGCSGSTNATTSYNLYSTGASAYRFYVGLGGTVFATSIVITAISDQRLKENVRDIETGLNAIMALKPRRFDWKDGKGQDKKNAAGFIAQEFAEIFPLSVSAGKAGGDGIEYLNMNHEELIPSLVKAMQEQQAMITTLQTQVTALQAKVGV